MRGPCRRSCLREFFQGDVDVALKAGAAAYAVNPNDTEVSGEYGFRLALSGKWETGCELMSSAINRNPGPIGYYEVGMAHRVPICGATTRLPSYGLAWRI